MKKLLSLLILCFSLSLVTGCTGNAEPSPSPSKDPSAAENGSPQFATFRIVSGAETGQLVLAKHEGTASEVYLLSLDTLEIKVSVSEPFRNGQLINVYFEEILESYPLQFSGVTAVERSEWGFDDRCALYLKVLEDLWAVDPALSEDVEILGVDLSQTSLTPAEQAAVGWVFASRHNAELAEGSLEELTEQGWITATPLSISGSGLDLNEPEHFFYEWKNGCHFSITEQPMEGSYSLTPVTFDAMKWRSSLGAYLFCDCTALQSTQGEWSAYQIGAEAIS